ncbi:MAG: hypothetical protein F6K58_31790, partial [Symploca sp. SIO2E9]|nr:hypothetical protein [Symploca sp. SIO2E9]
MGRGGDGERGGWGDGEMGSRAGADGVRRPWPVCGRRSSRRAADAAWTPS